MCEVLFFSSCVLPIASMPSGSLGGTRGIPADVIQTTAADRKPLTDVGLGASVLASLSLLSALERSDVA